MSKPKGKNVVKAHKTWFNPANMQTHNVPETIELRNANFAHFCNLMFLLAQIKRERQRL